MSVYIDIFKEDTCIQLTTCLSTCPILSRTALALNTTGYVHSLHTLIARIFCLCPFVLYFREKLIKVNEYVFENMLIFMFQH